MLTPSSRCPCRPGRIKALQLDYSEAHEYLTQAARKAPSGAVGFLQHVHKLDVIVTMLLGELPERELFRRKELAMPLLPYFELTQGAARLQSSAEAQASLALPFLCFFLLFFSFVFFFLSNATDA